VSGDDELDESAEPAESVDSAEPVEPDPEADLTDYEEELVDVPEPPEAPAPPSVPDPSENLRDGDVPRYVRTYFWRTVLIVDYAIAAVAIGPMLAYFRGDLQLGAGLTASGLFAFGYAYVLYRRFQRASDAHDDAGDDAGETTATQAESEREATPES
jgi:hypothetical protein